MRLERFLTNSARRLPGKIALKQGQTSLSYQELDEASDSLATRLVREGLKRGDRVIIFMGNRLEAVIALFAVQKAGAVFSPINPSTKFEKLAYILNDCEAKAVITEARLGGVVKQAVAKAPFVKFVISAGLQEADCGEEMISFKEAVSCVSESLPFAGINIDLSMLIYTSGTTGSPKGVMMTHLNVVTAAEAIITYLKNTQDDIILSVLPLSFDYGLYQVLMSVMTGATLVLEKSFAFPQVVLARLAEEKATGFPLVPTMAALLLQLDTIKPGDFPHLRYISNTAAALPVSHIKRLHELFPDVSFYSMYGLTECKRCTYMPPDQLSERPDSVGIAIPGTEAFIVDGDGKPVGPKVVGELVIRGAHVMKGYWNNKEATDKALKPGHLPLERLLYTGDLFEADEDGFLYFVGRKDDIIKTRGEKIAPKEVEAVLHELSGVNEAVIVGVADPILGKKLCAILVVKQGQSIAPREVIRHCARRLEDFMVPQSVLFYDRLPRTGSGKIDYRRLREGAARDEAVQTKRGSGNV